MERFVLLLLLMLTLSGCDWDKKPEPKTTPAPVIVLIPDTINLAKGQEVLDFTAVWCGPCRANAPAIDQLEREGVKITRLDMDLRPLLARKWHITSVPTYVILVNGRETYRTHSVAELRSHLK